MILNVAIIFNKDDKIFGLASGSKCTVPAWCRQTETIFSPPLIFVAGGEGGGDFFFGGGGRLLT